MASPVIRDYPHRTGSMNVSSCSAAELADIAGFDGIANSPAIDDAVGNSGPFASRG